MLTSQPLRSRRLGISLLGAVACMVLVHYPGRAAGQTALGLDRGEASAVTHDGATIDWAAPIGADPKIEATVFYGTDDEFTDDKAWEHRAEMAKVDGTENEFRVVLEGLEQKTSYTFRVRVSGPTGVTWSPNTVFSTPAWQMSPYLLALIVVALLAVPFYVGGVLAKRFRMPDHGWKIGVILCTVASGLVIVGLRWPPKLGIDLVGGTILVYEVADTSDADAQKASQDKGTNGEDEGKREFKMNDLVHAISMRVNPGGAKEMTVRQYGSDQIEIIIPRVSADEAAQVERIISRAGNLEFRILANTRDHGALIARALADDTTTVLRNSDGEREAWWVPIQKGQEAEFQQILLTPESRREVAVREVVSRGETVLEVLVVQDRHNVSGNLLSDAAVGTDEDGAPRVEFRFGRRGAGLFGRLTAENLPDENGVQTFFRRLGIILDGHLYSAPNIKSKISDNGVIDMASARTEAEKKKRMQEVDDLVQVLNAGSLPTALEEEPISKMVTGATLGRDTIVRSCWAIGASAVLVLVFMLFYYRFAGLVASVALLINLVLILAIMITINAAFTLPGLAGLVLTLGMSVDANILVFERIREELARGAALRMAIRNGFARATTTIVDANLTTLITGIILFVIGSDQVKGFALTLNLGVLMCLFTAVFCSRVVFEIAERQHWITKLSMAQFLGNTNFDFLSKRRLAATCSTVLILAGLAGVVARGRGLLDIDFTGGVSVVTVFDSEMDIKDIRAIGLPDLAAGELENKERPDEAQFWINTSVTASDTDQVTEWIVAAVRAQLRDVFADGADSAERTEALEAFRKQVVETLTASPSTESKDKARAEAEREAATIALRDQALALFTGAPDGPKKASSLDVVRREVDRMARIRNATDYVEEFLHQQFLSKLATNVMSVESLASIEPPPGDPGPMAEAPETPDVPAEPASTDQGRNDLPGEDLIAFADSSLVLLAMGTPGQVDEAAPEETGEVPAEDESSVADEAPAEETDALAEDGSNVEPGSVDSAEETPASNGPEMGDSPSPGEGPVIEPAAEPGESDDAANPTNEEPSAEVPTETVEAAPATTSEIPAEAGREVAVPASGRFVGGTQARLSFTRAISLNGLKALFASEYGGEANVPTLELTPLVPSLTPGAPPEPVRGFRESESKSYDLWAVKIQLTPDEAQKRLGSIGAALAELPYFPSSNTIGGKVADDTKVMAIYALAASLLCLVAYIWIRFQRVVFGLAAVVALVHDVLVTLGAIALSAYLADYLGFLMIGDFKIGLTVLAAFLTIIGYSLNDTIVVFDRIREVRGKAPRLTEDMINASVNQTLSRTVLTAATTFIVVLILYLFGGEVIHAFAFSLVVGVVVGTYSSIYIASPVLLWMSETSKSE